MNAINNTAIDQSDRSVHGKNGCSDNNVEHATVNSCNKTIQKSVTNGDLHVPFTLLAGETTEHYYHGKETFVLLTNYRLFTFTAQSFSNIPVRCIEFVEMRELLTLHVNCKDGCIIRLLFECPDDCSDWWRYITSSEANDVFAFHYFENLNIMSSYEIIVKPSLVVDSADCCAGIFVDDVRRMGFNTKSIWRISEVNSKFEMCKTYPKFHIVPAWISDEDLKTVAQFRAMRRFPSVVWRSRANGAVIARSSQPELGWFGWRCEKDEFLLSAIAHAAKLDSNSEKFNMSVSVTDVANALPQSFLLVDARSYTAAVANRAKGGGCECQEYYPNCEIQFMGLPNIHVIRKSLHSLRALCYLGKDQNNWLSALESTRWLQHISALLRTTHTIVESINDKAQSTLIHCSDGWDRTPQLVSLSELLLDPHYRTIKGFRVLIEREWLEFGHKFADRCGHSTERDLNEKSPVFLQWLDAVRQLLNQFPAAFEFNEFFLLKLSQHAYSCLYGTFLSNSSRDRYVSRLKSKTVSVWELLLSRRRDFQNYLYTQTNQVLYPSYQLKDLTLWERVFIKSQQFYSEPRSSETTKQNDFSDSGNFTSSSAKNGNGTREYSSNYIHNQCKLLPEVKNSSDCANTNGFSEHLNENSYSINVDTPTLNGSNTADTPTLNGSNTVDTPTLNGSDTVDTPTLNGSDTVDTSTLNGSVTVDTSTLNGSDTVDTPTLNGSDTVENLEENSNLENYVNTHNEIMLKNFNISDLKLSDSVRTLTGDSERRKSFDDTCLPLHVETNLVSSSCQGSGNVRRSLSSSESPSLTNHLTRTKSVPDVMSSSMSAEPAKQTYECAQSVFPSGVNKLLDVDGMTLSYSFIEQRLFQLENRHSQDLSKLYKRLEMERQVRVYLQQHHPNEAVSATLSNFSEVFQDDQLSLPDSMNGERSSISSVSNDEGWEQVQYDDVQPTRWVPDHLSSSCANCGCSFSVVFRKHHCRKCGGIFCDTCSRHQITVPEESLYTPVRVCTKCYVHSSVS